nr:reverse transcriptase domain-containing protein [Tanacetum cinerariifolium]
IMDKVRCDRRKEVHARLDFEEGSRERRTGEGSHYSSARTLSVRPERLKVQNRLRYNDRHVLGRLEAALTGGTLLTEIVLRVGTAFVALGSHIVTPTPSTGRGSTTDIAIATETVPANTKKGRDTESPLSRVSKSDSSDEGNWKSKSKRHKPTDEDDLTMPWMCEEVDPFTPSVISKVHAMPTWCHMFNSTLIGAARVWFDELPPESINSYKDLKVAFLAYFMQQKKYIKDPVEIHNIKQKDGETIKDFMKRFKVETRCMKGAPECMRISEFMHGVNNLELTKRLNEHVPKTMEEMMITTTAFIHGEAVAGSKKKGHTSWRTQDQLKRQTSEKRSDFRGKLSHLIKEIKQGRDQSKVRKKEAPTKDKPTTIYMIQSWQRITRQKVTQSFERVREIMFPSLATSSGTEGPLVIEAEIGGHMIHRMYVDGGSLTEPSHMTGVPRSVAEHQLNIREGYSPIRQKKRGQAPERAKAIQAEDCYPIPEIDWKVESLCGCPFKCFLDAYKGYHQIQLAESDEEKTAFHTSQGVLADFLAELPDKSPPGASVVETQQELWTLFTDGSSCLDGSGDGHILISPEGTKFTYALRFQFAASNNEAENEALIAGLWIAAHMVVQNVHVSVDSNLVANQVLGAYVAKEENMIKYLEKVKSLHARGTTISGGQSHTAGILLANDAPGRMRYDTYMQRLSNTSSRDKKPPTASNPNHGSVAILQVEN